MSAWTPIERLVDRLPVNLPYEGVVAEAYDTWLPPGTELPGDAYLAELVDDQDGPALELGSGNGRLLIPLLEDGLAVEGIDSAASMNRICAAHAAARGLDVTLHRGDMAPLRLGGRYASIICPAGTFTLVDDVERAGQALASYHDHLAPGGALALALFVPVEEFDSRFEWRLRRTGTTDDGRTHVVHEAVCCDRQAQLQVSVTRLEVYDGDGRLTDTIVRKQRLRWWQRHEIEAALTAAGFAEVGSEGSDTFWITVARRR